MRPVVEDSDLFRRIEFEGFDHATGDEAEFIGLVEQVESELRGHYEQIRTAVSQIEATLATTPARFAALRLQVAITQAQADYQALLERLKSQGVESPDQYAALVARRDELQKELKRLDAGLHEQAGYIQQAEQVLEELTQLRHEISESRKDFITEINQRAGNRIRLSLSRFGTPEIAETRFRELIKQPTAFRGYLRSAGGRRQTRCAAPVVQRICRGLRERALCFEERDPTHAAGTCQA